MPHERRKLLTGLGLASLAVLAPRAKAAMAPTNDKVLVNVFLRGGADALNMIVPYGDGVYGEQYRNARPRLKIPSPHDSSVDRSRRGLEIGGGFALHPAMQPLHDIFTSEDGDIAFVHAVGPKAETRSHFDAQDIVERGWDSRSGPATGWLARYLKHMHGTQQSGNRSLFRATALGRQVPVALYGVGAMVSVKKLEELSLYLPSRISNEPILETYGSLYAKGSAIDGAANDLAGGIQTLDQIRDSLIEPPEGLYPATDFSSDLQEVSKVIKSREVLGAEAFCVDLGGWDTHASQANKLSGLLTTLSEGLKAFYDDMKQAGLGSKVTVVVMSEFGRRVHENGSRGTDHGSGSCMMVIGGGVEGGLYYRDWYPLEAEAASGLEDIAGRAYRGDLMTTTDQRTVLAEVMRNLAPNADLDAIFPPETLDYDPLGLYTPGQAKAPSGPSPKGQDEGESSVDPVAVRVTEPPPRINPF